MPQPFKIDRPRRFEVTLPASVLEKLKLELYSPLEGKIPHGRASELFTELAKDWLRSRGITP